MKPQSFLKIGWTENFFDLVHNETKLSCIWKLNHNVLKNAIRITGDCQCNAKLLAKTMEENKMSVHITNIDPNFVHKGTRKLKGSLKEKALELLEKKTPLLSRLEMVDASVENIDDHIPPTIPGLSQLKQLRYTESVKAMPDKNVMKSLNKMKTLTPDLIFEIGYNPFYVFYNVPIQREWYRRESMINRMCLCVDATGSLIIPPEESTDSHGTGKKKHIFLYNLMAKREEGKSVTIHQAISQTQNTSFIVYWLSRWFEFSQKPPAEIVCDQSRALINAILRTFTSCKNLDTYVKRCLSALDNNGELPEIFLRFDRSHIVNNMKKRITNTDFRKEKLFQNVFGYLIQCNDMNEVKKIVTNLFTTIYNKYDGVSTWPAEKANKFLMTLATQHMISMYHQQYKFSIIFYFNL